MLNSVPGEYFSNELAIASQGLEIGTMLDGNKELPIKIRGMSDNFIESTQFLSMPSKDGFDYPSSYGAFEVT